MSVCVWSFIPVSLMHLNQNFIKSCHRERFWSFRRCSQFSMSAERPGRIRKVFSPSFKTLSQIQSCFSLKWKVKKNSDSVIFSHHYCLERLREWLFHLQAEPSKASLPPESQGSWSWQFWASKFSASMCGGIQQWGQGVGEKLLLKVSEEDFSKETQYCGIKREKKKLIAFYTSHCILMSPLWWLDWFGEKLGFEADILESPASKGRRFTSHRAMRGEVRTGLGDRQACISASAQPRTRPTTDSPWTLSPHS